MRKEDIDKVYLRTAIDYGKLSYAIKRKVGAVLVTPEHAMFPGFNGTLPGLPNVCESYDHIRSIESPAYCEKCNNLYTEPTAPDVYKLSPDCSVPHTLPTVIHAEKNAIKKALATEVSLEGSTLYITYFPCIECMKDLILHGITTIHVRDTIFIYNYDDKHRKRSVESYALFTGMNRNVYVYTNTLQYIHNEDFLEGGHSIHRADRIVKLEKGERLLWYNHLDESDFKETMI